MSQNQPPQAGNGPPYTVRQAMVNCGINDVDTYQNETPAERFANELFSDSFDLCMDKTIEEVKSDLKQYASLGSTDGQILTTPGNIQKIQAFIQWTRDMIRTGLEPASMEFPVHNTALLIKNYKSHQAYMDKTKTISDAAKPIKFKETSKWEDWYPTFLNFLRSIPGRNGVPLSYVCRDNDQPAGYDTNLDFIENYIHKTPLYGEAYMVDAAEVHTYLVNFMSGNNTAEVKMLPYAQLCDGRLDYKSLQDHYEGVGAFSLNLIKANQTINNLHYAGEKRPHMWWDEFEKGLTYAFTVVDKRERRVVYSDEMKLRILLQKVNVDFLQPIKTAINVELYKLPVTMTYNQALMNFRNEVNRKFPPDLSPMTNRNRRVNEANTSRTNTYNRGRGRGRQGGRGNNRGGGRGNRGRGRSRGTNRGHPDARWIDGIDGTSIEVHPSYNFPPHIWNLLPQGEISRINSERQQYRGSRDHKRQRMSTVASIPPAIEMHPNNDVAVNGSVISAVSTQQNGSQGSIMGGRNSQASLRTRNNASH